MKICVYSISIGNYRGELDKILKMEKPGVKGLDHYFISDRQNLQINGWNCIFSPVLKDVNGIGGSRRTSKYCKWGTLPKPLQSYDYALYLDASLVPKLGRVNHPDIAKQIARRPDAFIIHCKHPRRRTLYEEIVKVMHRDDFGLIDKKEKWKQVVNNKYDSIPLIQSNIFIRKVRGTSIEFEQAMDSIPRMLDVNGLWRDQTVWAVAMKDEFLKKNIAFFDKKGMEKIVCKVCSDRNYDRFVEMYGLGRRPVIVDRFVKRFNRAIGQ